MKRRISSLWVLLFGLVLSLGAGACGVDASSQEAISTPVSAGVQPEATSADKALPQAKIPSQGGDVESLCFEPCLSDADCTTHCSADWHGGCYLALCVKCRALGVTCQTASQCCSGMGCNRGRCSYL